MQYSSPKKKALFLFLLVSIFLGLWLLWLGIEVFLLQGNPLAHVEGQKAVIMAILAAMLFFTLLAGLILSTLLGNKRYSKYFSFYIGFLFMTLLTIKAIFG